MAAEFKQTWDRSRGALVVADAAARLLTVATLLDLAAQPDRAAVWALCATALAALRVWLRSVRTERAMRTAYELLVRAVRSWDARALGARREDQRGVVMLIESTRSGALSEGLARAELESAVLASAAFAVLALLRLGPRFALLSMAGALVLAAITAPGRRLARRARAESWKAYGVLAASLRTLVEACLELRAVGAEHAYAEHVRARAAEVTRTELEIARTTYLTALLPSLLALGALAVPPSWLDGFSRQGLEFAVLGGAGIALSLGTLSALDQWQRGAPARLTFKSLSSEHAGALTQTPKRPREATAEFIRVVRVRGLSVLHPGAQRPTPSALSFDVGPAGVALLGANGSGKSTALLAMMGLLPADEGTVEFETASTTHQVDEIRTRIAYHPQNPHVDPGESVRTHLELFGMRGMDRDRRNAALRALDLEALLLARGLGDLEQGLATPMSALSGGEQRRVLLARALGSDADILFFDEPEAGLDTSRRAQLRALLEAEAAKRLVVLIAHDLEVIPATFERVSLERGRATSDR